MSKKLIDFVDTERILNGYINNEYATVEVVKEVVNQLKKGECSGNVKSIKLFTNRFAYIFSLKENKIIASKQCENCALNNGKPIRPTIVDEQNPYYAVSDGKSRKLTKDAMRNINKDIEQKRITATYHTEFKDVAEATEFIYNTVKDEYMVITRPVYQKPVQFGNKEGFYVVYEASGELKLAFGDTRGIEQSQIKYRGYDTFKDATARYKQFKKDIA